MADYNRIAKSLYAIDFDHPFTLSSDGTIGESDAYAPIYCDDEMDSPNWEPVTAGMSGQYGYAGPVMHNSERIGARMAERLCDLADRPEGPVTLVIALAYWTSEYDEDTPYVDGWLIVQKRD